MSMGHPFCKLSSFRKWIDKRIKEVRYKVGEFERAKKPYPKEWRDELEWLIINQERFK